MLVRVPCERFLIFSVIHPQRYSNETIRGYVEGYKLDYIGDWYLEKLREKWRPPERFRPRDPFDDESQQFLMKAEVQELFFPDDDMRIAYSILDNAQAKSFIEQAGINQAPLHPLVEMIRTRAGMPNCTAGAALKYFRFFWDLKMVDRTDLKVILNLRGKAAANSEDPFVRGYQAEYEKVWRMDHRCMAAGMPNNAYSAMIGHVRDGMAVPFDKSEMLERVQDMSIMRSYEVLSNDAKGCFMMARDGMSVAGLCQQLLDSRAKPEEALRKQLAQLHSGHDDTKVPTLQDLSGGRHTADLMSVPGQDSEEEEDDE